MLELLEYIHDPQGVLARARSAAQRLLLSYRVHGGGDTGERRADGLFNDLTREEVLALLEATDWKAAAMEEGPGYTLFLCRALSRAARLSEGDGRARSGWAGRLGLGRK
jgi:hypothetical protein